MSFSSFTRQWVLLLVTFLISAGIGRADDGASRVDKLNGGYYLLHHLLDDEAQLPMLLLIKHAPQSMSDYANEISKAAKEDIATLDRWHDHDDSIRFDRNPLPQIEQDIRASIKGEKQHQLLFGTTDSEFVRALLVSQIEATTYAGNISKVIGEQETDTDRAKALQRMSARWLALQSEAYRHLRDY